MAVEKVTRVRRVSHGFRVEMVLAERPKTLIGSTTFGMILGSAAASMLSRPIAFCRGSSPPPPELGGPPGLRQRSFVVERCKLNDTSEGYYLYEMVF